MTVRGKVIRLALRCLTRPWIVEAVTCFPADVMLKKLPLPRGAAATVVLTLTTPNPDMLFQLGFTTAVIFDEKSAATNVTQPIGTGPYRLESWAKGSSATLAKWDGYRDAAKIKIAKVTFRFISD